MDATLWSVNEYDRDGDVTEEGVYLHFGDTKIKVAESPYEFEILIRDLNNMIPEIIEAFGEI